MRTISAYVTAAVLAVSGDIECQGLLVVLLGVIEDIDVTVLVGVHLVDVVAVGCHPVCKGCSGSDPAGVEQ